MKRAAFALVLASLPAGCGGGGNVPPSPSIFVPPPPNAGAAAIYAQSVTVTADAGLVFNGLTCLTPQRAHSETVNANITQTVSTNQTFNGQSGLTAVTSSVALQGCSDGMEPLTEIDYFATRTAWNGTTAIVFTGGTAISANGTGTTNLSFAYTPSGLVVAELPFQSGRSWNSIPARTVNWNSETLKVNADGSYDDRTVSLNGTFPYESIDTVENNDASGKQTIVAGANASAPPYVRSLSAPSNNAVTVTSSGTVPLPPDAPTPTPCPTPGDTPCPSPSPSSSVDYAWYPYVPSPAHPFETIASTDKGAVSVPSACKLPSGLPARAELIETIDTSLDIWTGTNTTATDAYVDAKRGLLCAIGSVQERFYVLGPTNADTAPVATTTLTFTDTLQSAGAAAPVFALPAPARLLTLWR